MILQVHFELYKQYLFVSHPKNLPFWELSCPLGLFGLKRFHPFVILAQWEDGNYCLSCFILS